jgi:hypothetical protein
MNERGEYSDGSAVFRTPDDLLVVEIQARKETRSDIEQLIADSRATGADILWVHGLLPGGNFGFSQRGGYARLEAEHIPASAELANPPHEVVRDLQRLCFGGVWGHAEPDEPDPAARFVALNEGFQWVGICEFDVDAGWIDGPGVIPELRTPDRYARLVRGAVAHMKQGPITLETWGDSEEALAGYLQLGFQLVEFVPGWELRLGISEVPEAPS